MIPEISVELLKSFPLPDYGDEANKARAIVAGCKSLSP